LFYLLENIIKSKFNRKLHLVIDFSATLLNV